MTTSNTLFQSLDSDHKLSPKALTLVGSLDIMTSVIVGRLISERLIDYANEPGQTIEYLSAVIANALIESLEKADTVEIGRFFKWIAVPNED